MTVDYSRCGFDRTEFKLNLQRRIGPLLGAHEIEVEPAALENAITRAFTDIGGDYDDLQSRFLSLALSHIFARDRLWIDYRTKTGGLLSDDVLLSAYLLWHKALRFAVNRDLDCTKVASALDSAAQATADALAKGKYVVNMRKYMFTVYRNRILRGRRSEFRNMECGEANFSDGGIVPDKIERKILTRELLAVMPPQERCVVMLRYFLDCDWDKIAEIMGTTVNTAQKRHSLGCRKAREYYQGGSDHPGMKKRKKKRTIK